MAIILTKSDGTTDVTYTQQSNQGGILVFGNQSAGLVEPETLRIQHFLRPAGSKGTDRHNIVLQKSIVEDATNNFMVLSAEFRLSVPRSADVTLAMVKDIIAQLTSYVCRTANATTLFNGGTPDGDFNVTGPFNPSIA